MAADTSDLSRLPRHDARGPAGARGDAAVLHRSVRQRREPQPQVRVGRRRTPSNARASRRRRSSARAATRSSSRAAPPSRTTSPSRACFTRTPSRPRHIVTTAIEHKSVLDTCKRPRGRGLPCDVPARRLAMAASIRTTCGEAIADDTVLVSIMAANNEVGVDSAAGGDRRDHARARRPAAHRRGAGGGEDPARREDARRGPALVHRAQDVRSEGSRRAVHPASARAWRWRPSSKAAARSAACARAPSTCPASSGSVAPPRSTPRSCRPRSARLSGAARPPLRGALPHAARRRTERLARAAPAAQPERPLHGRGRRIDSARRSTTSRSSSGSACSSGTDRAVVRAQGLRHRRRPRAVVDPLRPRPLHHGRGDRLRGREGRCGHSGPPPQRSRRRAAMTSECGTRSSEFGIGPECGSRNSEVLRNAGGSTFGTERVAAASFRHSALVPQSELARLRDLHIRTPHSGFPHGSTATRRATLPALGSTSIRGVERRSREPLATSRAAAGSSERRVRLAA